jgi:5-methyltetrahydrofolate--homocysteine methyltransferase
MEPKLKDISEALIKGKKPLVKELVQTCLSNGVPPQEILNKGLIAGMNVIGKRFKKDVIFLPEVMIAARAMNGGLEILDPILSKSNIEPRGKIVLGTVQGDLHDVGKNLVSMMFRGAGFKVIDLGIDVSHEKFIKAVKENHPDILGLSALLTMTLPMMKTTIEAVDTCGLKDEVIIMVGGAPVTQGLADEIGAHGYASDAVTAVEKAIELMAATG